MIDTTKIDLSYIFEITKSDASFRKLLINTAKLEIAEDLQRIVEFKNQKNWKEAGAIVHKFKSKVDLFNLREDLETFRDMERKLRFDDIPDSHALSMVEDFINVQNAILEFFKNLPED